MISTIINGLVSTIESILSLPFVLLFFALVLVALPFIGLALVIVTFLGAVIK